MKMTTTPNAIVPPAEINRRRKARSPSAGCEPVHSPAAAHMKPGAAMMNPNCPAPIPKASCATTDSTIDAPK